MRLFVYTLIVWVVLVSPAIAMPAKQVKTKNGLTAWVIEDHRLPMVVVRFAFRGGVEHDPVDKQGLATLAVGMLTEGAGKNDALSLHQKLADHNIAIDIAANRDVIEGGFSYLTEDKDLALDLMRDVLAKPHLNPEVMERVRGQQLSALQAQIADPAWQARYALLQQVYGDHPYAFRRLGSSSTLSAISRDDVRAFLKQRLVRQHLSISIVGDVRGGDVQAVLDRVFGGLPEKSLDNSLKDAEWLDLSTKDTSVIKISGTQTTTVFALEGPRRNHPDWLAAEIANYILGGGGFQSHLMKTIRSQQGLTYGISTSLVPMRYGAMIMGHMSTDNTQTEQAMDGVRAVIQNFYVHGVSEKEVNAAKNYLSGATPLGLTSLRAIASALLETQLEGLPSDYLDQRAKLLRDVRVDDVNRVIRTWFNPQRMAVAMAGDPDIKHDHSEIRKRVEQ